jgi:hypothetical protein
MPVPQSIDECGFSIDERVLSSEECYAICGGLGAAGRGCPVIGEIESVLPTTPPGPGECEILFDQAAIAEIQTIDAALIRGCGRRSEPRYTCNLSCFIPLKKKLQALSVRIF